MTGPLTPTVHELAVRLRLDADELTAEERAALEAAAEDAAAMVAATVPAAVAARWAAAAPPVARVICLRAARREFENPRGAMTESIGGHYLALAPSGATGVYLTEHERHVLRTLAAPCGTPGTRAASIRVRAAYET